MRVIFVCFQRDSEVLGVKYLHAYIISRGYDSSILLVPDLKPNNIRVAIDYIIKCKPDVLCFSILSYEFQMAKYFVSVLKNQLSGCTVIFGGIHATVDPESCLAVADIVVRGEGEETLLELLQTLDGDNPDNISKVNGIVFKREGQTIYTTVRPPIQALDTLPYPRHIPESMYITHKGNIHSFKEPYIRKRYVPYQGAILYILTSRGCPFSCHYCCNSVFKSLYGKINVRIRSVESVIDEISNEIRNFADILYVLLEDDCFIAHSMNWIADFSERYSKEIGLPFFARAIPTYINKEKLILLKKAGLRWLSMGLQSGSDRINREVYGRNITSEEFLNAAKIVTEMKLSLFCQVIVDNPYETETDYFQTIDVLLRIPRPFYLGVYSLNLFPGTELRRRAIEDNLPISYLRLKYYFSVELKMINLYIRMSAILPSRLMRLLVRIRKTIPGRMIGISFYALTLLLEPFIHIWFFYRSNDFRIIRTIKAIKRKGCLELIKKYGQRIVLTLRNGYTLLHRTDSSAEQLIEQNFK